MSLLSVVSCLTATYLPFQLFYSRLLTSISALRVYLYSALFAILANLLGILLAATVGTVLAGFLPPWLAAAIPPLVPVQIFFLRKSLQKASSLDYRPRAVAFGYSIAASVGHVISLIVAEAKQTFRPQMVYYPLVIVLTLPRLCSVLAVMNKKTENKRVALVAMALHLAVDAAQAAFPGTVYALAATGVLTAVAGWLGFAYGRRDVVDKSSKKGKKKDKKK